MELIRRDYYYYFIYIFANKPNQEQEKKNQELDMGMFLKISLDEMIITFNDQCLH